MPSPRRIAVSCPSCGRKQLEPLGFITTICSGCGQSIRSQHNIAASPTSKLQKPRKTPPARTVHCFRCGTKSKADLEALSIICRGCDTQISLENVTIRGNASKMVDTRGHLRIERGAHLASTLALCGDATIAGRISGALVCTGKLQMLCGGIHPVRIEAEQIHIGKNVHFQCPYPVVGGDMDVRGHLHANIVCRGKLRIRRGAAVEGSVFARSIQVDRGGNLKGELKIGPPPPPELLRKPGAKDMPVLAVARPHAGRRRVNTV